MNIQTFIKAMKFSLLAAGKTDVRYYLNGVLFDVADDGVTTVVGTDGSRLSHLKFTETTGLEPGQYVFARDDMDMIVKALSVKKSDDYEVQIKASNDNNSFSIEKLVSSDGASGKWNGRLLDCTYPDYNRVIPASYYGKAEVVGMDADFVLDAMKAAKMVGAKPPVVKLAPSDGSTAMRYDVQVDSYLNIEEAFIILMPVRV